MSLSVCCATANPSRAVVVLSALREVADEIVVAVDVSGGEQDLTQLETVADRLFEIELVTFVESALAWLHAQCSAEWILRVDDDEVPSARLLEELPELMRARDIVQYWLARRWLYPDAEHWLEGWPWFPDFQGRLVRNDARLWFPGLCHTSVAFTPPARYLDGGLYHAAHLLASRAERERKVERYLQVDPALRETDADAHLPTYYLPERDPDAELAAVDVDDLDLIGAVLGRSGEHRPDRQAPRGARLRRRVSRAEVQARWAARTFDEAGYRASITPIDVHRQLVADEHRPFRVSVRNEGTEWWPGGGEERRPLIRLAYRWLTPQGISVESEGHRTALPHPLAPGERGVVAMHVTAPSIAGRYVLAPDLVHEHVRWFQCESTPLEMLISTPETVSRLAMTLSVCCLTKDPGARVAAIMRQLRPVADEIVIAVDSRLDPRRLGRYAEAADRLLRYEFVDSSLQAVPWLIEQCSGEWVLQIDGDEVFSPALIERLPELIAARDVFQYWLPCRWLYPDAEHYLAQPPWHFSASRLVRNDPTVLRHGGLSHGRFEPVFPSVHLGEGFYHLSLLINELAYREAKVAHYLSIASGHDREVLETDLTAFYVPELDERFGIAPVPVPRGDRAAIKEVLAASGEELPSPEEVPLCGWSEIERAWPRRTFAEDAYWGEIELFERAPRLYEGQQRALTVRVTNAGTEHWPGLHREPWIKLAHRWHVSNNGSGDGAWSETCLPASIAPGAGALVPLAIEAPMSAGRHRLECALVHEDLLHGRVIRRFAETSIQIDVLAAGESAWSAPTRADVMELTPGA